MRAAPLLLLGLLLIVPRASAQAPSAAAAPDVAAVVAAFIAAMDRGDYQAAADLYAPAFKVDHVMGRRVIQDQTREGMLVQLRGQAGLRNTVTAQIVDGPFVFQKVQLVRPDGTPAGTTNFVYEVADGRIIGLWHFDGPSTMAARARAAATPPAPAPTAAPSPR